MNDKTMEEIERLIEEELQLIPDDILIRALFRRGRGGVVILNRGAPVADSISRSPVEVITPDDDKETMVEAAAMLSVAEEAVAIRLQKCDMNPPEES